MKEELIEQAVKFILNYASNIVDKVLPESPEPKELEIIENTTLVAYSAAKGFGKDIVEDTKNDYDDKMVEELIESCENTAERYSFSLDATTW